MIETERERMRKANMYAALAASILSVLFTTAAAGQEEFPFRINKVSDRVTVFQAWKHMENALNLVYFGRAHSDSDILIHIPEQWGRTSL
jgi:hypothetical protein